MEAYGGAGAEAGTGASTVMEAGSPPMALSAGTAVCGARWAGVLGSSDARRRRLVR